MTTRFHVSPKSFTELRRSLAAIESALNVLESGASVSQASAASSTLTTKGDLLTRDGTDTIRLGVGTNGQVLTADSVEADGLDWKDAASGVTDHGALTGLVDDDHSQYLRADGARTLTDDMLVTALKKIDGRDLSVDGGKLDSVEASATADQSDAEIETAYNAQVAAVSQATAEAGTDTAITRWTAERVKQAIAALESGLANIVEDTTPELGGELDALGNAIIDSTTNLKIGMVGDTEFGDGTERNVNPQTDLKINLGSASKRYNEAYIDSPRIAQPTTGFSANDTPTKAEITAALGGNVRGKMGTVDEGSLENDVFLCISTDNNWYYLKFTKAV